MRKVFLSVALLIFILSTAIGQSDSSKARVIVFTSINAGAGLPLTFSLSLAHLGAENSTYGANALTGPSINIYTTIRKVHNKFGVSAMIGYEVNRYNSDYSNLFSNVGNYSIINAMVGLFYRIPFKLNSIDFHVLGGALYFETPELIYSGNFNNGALAPGYNVDERGRWTLNSASNISFCTDIGISLKCKIAKKLVLALNADILNSGLHGGLTTTTQFTGYYNRVPINSNNSYYAWLGNFSYSEMGLLNLTAGLGYRF